tara:strand:+ start:686 stop:2416 length:1731 start_codon:yes stop_codon:yes gene_type:complete
MIMFFASFVIAEEHDVCTDDDCKIDKAYSCLRDEINDKGCDKLSPEEKVFSLLAVGKCKSEVVDDSRYKSDIIYTSQAIIAGSSSSDVKSWLFDKSKTSIGIDWFLEIESPKATTCDVDYSSSNEITINEDKTIDSVTGGSCLSLSSNKYWLEVDPDCYDEEFTVSCDEQFLTTLLYQEKNSDTIFVSEKTSSASAEGMTEEKVNSSCFGEDGCNYEETLWASLALNVLKEDVKSYLPYLITMKDKEENEDFLSEAFLYSLTGNVDFKNQLLSKQINNKWWVFSDDRYYGTALALYPLQYEEPSQKKDSINWLLNEAQEENGCWDSRNIRNTAFILHSISPQAVSVSSGGIDCEGAGYFCASQINCAGEVLSGYDCSGAFVCCSEDVILKICSEQGGEICNSNQNCVGVGSLEVDSAGLSAGQACCTSGTCQEPQTTVSSCESSGGACRVSGCLENEEKTFESCDFSSDVCCVQKTTEKGSYFWIWVLFILIVLVVLGIIFRDKLRPYWFMIKSKFDKFKSSKSAPAIGPGTPPPRTSPLRRVVPHAEKRPLRRMPMRKSQGEVDDVLKKLKEMGK